MFKNCCAVVYAINWEQDSGERTPGLEGKILKFEFELKVLNSILSKLLNKRHLVDMSGKQLDLWSSPVWRWCRLEMPVRQSSVTEWQLQVTDDTARRLSTELKDAALL